MSFLLNIFSNFKNIFMSLGAVFVSLYVAKQKYKAYQAEDKLKNIETEIAKTNVTIIKNEAKAKAKSIKIENNIEVGIIKQLEKNKEKIKEEMFIIEKNIEDSISNKKFTIEV